MFGVAFGQYLVDDLGLSWKVVEDQYGTEMAVSPNGWLVDFYASDLRNGSR